MAFDPLAHPEALIRRVHAYVAYRLGDAHDAEDATSEVFARALRGRETYDASRAAPVAWLLGIARRVIAEEFARRAVAPSAELREVAATGDLEEDLMLRLTLVAGVRALGERDAELIALRYGADLPAGEVARLLGMRKNAVEVALHRARNRLADLLRAAGAQGAAHVDPEVEDEDELRAVSV
jgi:RNA polymerase sigma-70 factor (ECF subfamily)